jgi:hypothetical protein
VDEFDQDDACRQMNEGQEIPCGLLAAQGEAFEALDAFGRLLRAELADGLLDPGASLVKGFGEEGGLDLGIRLVRDDRRDAAVAGGFAVGLAVIAFEASPPRWAVADGGARLDVGAEVEKRWKLRRIALLAAGQIEGKKGAFEIGLQVDFGRKPAARAAERLAFLPPFAPAAETWARTTVESNICTKWADDERLARCSKNISKTPLLLKRSNRFHMLSHLPKRSGSARHVML